MGGPFRWGKMGLLADSLSERLSLTPLAKLAEETYVGGGWVVVGVAAPPASLPCSLAAGWCAAIESLIRWRRERESGAAKVPLVLCGSRAEFHITRSCLPSSGKRSSLPWSFGGWPASSYPTTPAKVGNENIRI